MQKQTEPILLFDDECGVCRRIAHWVKKSAHEPSGKPSLIERPIGDDPEALRLLNPGLDIWDAYATIHLLMPDGSMKLGGEAVAEVLRNLPQTRWFASCFSVSIFGLRPFQAILDVAYSILADVRPLFGCESCGQPRAWLRPLHWLIERVKMVTGVRHQRPPIPHFTPRSAVSPPARLEAAKVSLPR